MASKKRGDQCAQPSGQRQNTCAAPTLEAPTASAVRQGRCPPSHLSGASGCKRCRMQRGTRSLGTQTGLRSHTCGSRVLQQQAADIGTAPVRLVRVAAEVCKYSTSLPERTAWPP
eukprot:scaffold89520_cov60-Phaeocystis_antarctica.AAC.2